MVCLKSGLWWALAGVVFFNCPTYAQAGSPSLGTLETKAEGFDSTRSRRVTGDWSLELGGATVQEGKNSGDGSYLYFSPNFEFRLMPEFKVKLSPWARFYSLRIQDRFKDDDSDGFIFLSDAYAAYTPAQWVELRAGILSQRILRTSMMVSNYTAFPGVQAILRQKLNNNFEANFIGQYTVPTSSSGTADRDRTEELPTFKTLHAELKAKKIGGWELQGYGGYFEWDKLPAKVAIKSATMGNANVDGELVTRFTRGFRGYFGGASACFCEGNLGLNLEFKRMHNVEAQSYSADGQFVGGGPRFKWSQYELDMRYHSYFIESDSTVAYYNKSRFGHTNRTGDHAEINLHLLKHGFSLFMEMYNARPIARDDNQRNLQEYFFGVETDNVSFF